MKLETAVRNRRTRRPRGDVGDCLTWLHDWKMLVQVEAGQEEAGHMRSKAHLRTLAVELSSRPLLVPDALRSFASAVGLVLDDSPERLEDTGSRALHFWILV
jgi:hypothetical protein